MALKLTMRPADKIIVNGAVFENGGTRNISLLLQNKVAVLLQKDFMEPSEADTPTKRLYVMIMLMYMDEDARDAVQTHFSAELKELRAHENDPVTLCHLQTISDDVASGGYYRALMRCRKLIARAPCEQTATAR